MFCVVDVCKTLYISYVERFCTYVPFIYFDTYFPCLSNCWDRPRGLQKIVYWVKSL